MRIVDYADHASLVFALQGVHTIISTISVNGPESQLALLEAAKEAGAKRFAPSEFAGQVMSSALWKRKRSGVADDVDHLFQSE